MKQIQEHCRRVILMVLAIGVLAILSGCSSGGATPRGTADEGPAQISPAQMGVPQAGQTMFASPEQAAAVFKDAVTAGDRRMLLEIFGDDSRQFIFTGDHVQVKNDLQKLSGRMNEYLHVEYSTDDKAIVRVGKEYWPFPIPIVKTGDQWFFDTAAGRDELLNRQIGEDELNAIAVCKAYVAAQKEYAGKDHTGDGIRQYAQHFMSHPGKQDGLYWEVAAGEELSPMGPLVAEARMEGYPAAQPTNGQPHPYHGYIFHILKAQGEAASSGEMSYIVDGKMTKGFAMIASPSVYGTSGIMTFIVAKDGNVYQKNLGDSTSDAVKAMSEYNPDKSWEEVKD
jgi:hypothetical protein